MVDERDQIGEPPEIGRLTAKALAKQIEDMEARIGTIEHYTHAHMGKDRVVPLLDTRRTK